MNQNNSTNFVRIESAIRSLEELYKDVSQMESKWRDIESRQHNQEVRLHAEIASLTNTVESLTLRVDDLQKEKNQLEVLYQNARDEVEALRKVSHIIAVQKENAKLRTELERLKATVTPTLSCNQTTISVSFGNESRNEVRSVVDKLPESHETEHIESNNSVDSEVDRPINNHQCGEEHDYDVDDTSCEDDNLVVFEKKFNKKVYYVSDDEKMLIFEVLSDGGIGDEVGHCIKEKNKLIPIWKHA